MGNENISVLPLQLGKTPIPDILKFMKNNFKIIVKPSHKSFNYLVLTTTFF